MGERLAFEIDNLKTKKQEQVFTHEIIILFTGLFAPGLPADPLPGPTLTSPSSDHLFFLKKGGTHDGGGQGKRTLFILSLLVYDGVI